MFSAFYYNIKNFICEQIDKICPAVHLEDNRRSHSPTAQKIKLAH